MFQARPPRYSCKDMTVVQLLVQYQEHLQHTVKLQLGKLRIRFRSGPLGNLGFANFQGFEFLPCKILCFLYLGVDLHSFKICTSSFCLGKQKPTLRKKKSFDYFAT